MQLHRFLDVMMERQWTANEAWARDQAREEISLKARNRSMSLLNLIIDRGRKQEAPSTEAGRLAYFWKSSAGLSAYSAS